MTSGFSELRRPEGRCHVRKGYGFSQRKLQRWIAAVELDSRPKRIACAAKGLIAPMDSQSCEKTREPAQQPAHFSSIPDMASKSIMIGQNPSPHIAHTRRNTFVRPPEQENRRTTAKKVLDIFDLFQDFLASGGCLADFRARQITPPATSARDENCRDRHGTEHTHCDSDAAIRRLIRSEWFLLPPLRLAL